MSLLISILLYGIWIYALCNPYEEEENEDNEKL